MNTIDIQCVLDELRQQRPVFHSEADFQHALAWELHRQHPSAAVRLEMPISGSNGQREHIDIWVRDSETVCAIELKYKTKKLDIVCNGEGFHLLDQLAPDIARYEFIKDICRLEHAVKLHPASIGYAVLLTNVEDYWQVPRRIRATNDAMFRVHEGCTLKGELRWGDAAGYGTKKGRETPLVLKHEYTLRWSDYSALAATKGSGAFRYAIATVVMPVVETAPVHMNSSL